MVKIGVVSDTHLTKAADLPDELLQAFADVNLILHAGDLISLDVLERLKQLGAPVYAVRGNMDSYEVKRALPEIEIVQIKEFRIGLTHGSGAPFNLIRTVKERFKNKQLNAIVYGHSHSPCNEIREGVLFFNPGSPTDRFFARYNSYGIMEIGKRISAKIIKLKK